jgi:hypothetical protein
VTNLHGCTAHYVSRAQYDRQSGETTIKECRYDENYATFYKRDPEHKGMLVMVSPHDGRVQAIVEVCQKRKYSCASFVSERTGINRLDKKQRN